MKLLIVEASYPKDFFGERLDAVACTILYNLFRTHGVHRDVAREALRAISAVVHPHFRYLRWHDDRRTHLQYPGEGERYEVTERVKKERIK
jgi:hypothetical protein